MASQLDAPQIVQEVYNPENKSIKVTPIGAPIDVDWDYMSLTVGTDTIPNDKETYTFYVGGSGGSVVKTIVIVYTDGGRTLIKNVTVSA